MRSARRTAEANAAFTSSMSVLVIARGVCQSGAKASAEGAIVSQAPSSGLSGLPPNAGGCVEPLRPECPSCRPCLATPYWRQKSITRLSAASFASLCSIAHFSEMRP